MRRAVAGQAGGFGGRAALLVGAVCAVGLAACGGATTTGATTPTSTPAATSSTPSSTQTRPGAAGTLAAISGSTLEVQSPSAGQVSVDLTRATAITQTVRATSAKVVVGACVLAIGAPTTSGTTTGQVAARSVTITQPGPGGCTRAGPFGGFGGGPTNAFHRRATGSPAPGSHKARSASFASAFGKVTSASKASFVVQTTTGPTTVDFTASSTFTEVTPATSSVLKVGDCVVATGPASQIGTVTATRLSVRSPGPDGCSTPLRPGGAG